MPSYMKTRPLKHQFDVFMRFHAEKSHAMFWKMGRGKTKTTIDFMNFAFINNKINLAIVIAPKGVHENWIHQEFPKHSKVQTNLMVLRTDGGRKYSEAIYEWHHDQDPTRLKVLALNYDLLLVDKVFAYLKSIISKHEVFLVLDESSRIKNPKAKRTKRVLVLSDLPNVRYKRILSGTPLTKNCLDLFTQYQALDPRILGFSSFYGYKTFICNIKKQQISKTLPNGGIKRWEFEKILGFKNLDIIQKRTKPFTSVVQDTSDLPDKIFCPVEISLTGEQAEFYKQVKNEIFVTLSEAGQQVKLSNLDTLLAAPDFQKQIASLDSVTSDFVLTKRIRLREILGGFLKTDQGNYRTFKENAKLEFLLEDTEDLEEKTIIWSSFVYEIEMIEQALLKIRPRAEVATLYGKVKNYNQIVETFKKSGHFLVANPAVGGLGFDIPQASVNYYYSRDFNAENYWQSQDRTHRIGQVKNVVYKILIARNTVDSEIDKNLSTKHDNLQQFLKGGA